MGLIYGNLFLDHELLEESLRSKRYLASTEVDLSNIKLKDIDDIDKFRSVMYKLQKEEDEREKKYSINIIITHVLSMILTPVYGIGFIVAIINLLITVIDNIPATKIQSIIKRLEQRKKKTEDKEEIKKIDKLIEKLETEDAKNYRSVNVRNDII